jgi:hypothetical protein
VNKEDGMGWDLDVIHIRKKLILYFGQPQEQSSAVAIAVAVAVAVAVAGGRGGGGGRGRGRGRGRLITSCSQHSRYPRLQSVSTVPSLTSVPFRSVPSNVVLPPKDRHI